MAGFIELIAKIKPKNNGKYPLVDDVDVEMEDGSRLSEAIKKPRIPDGGTEGQILAKKSNTNGDVAWVEPLKTEDIDKKLESKLDKNLGSENSDKVLTTDSQGNIITQDKEEFEGGGGTTNYDDLENKPQINGVELNGNKTSGDLKMYTQEEVDDLLYDKMDKPYKPITITDDITIEDCLDGHFKINKILGNTYQAEESDIVPTPQRPIPINSRKTTITKINPNIFDLEKESDTSKIPDSGTYRSIGQHQLKANTKYIFEWTEATVPAKATLSLQIQDEKGTVLVSPFTYFNLESTEKKETGKEVEFTTNSSGIVKFAYNCTVGTSNTTETYQQYWYTKILKDISLKEDVEYEFEYVELRSLKETANLFDLGLQSRTELIEKTSEAYRKINIPLKLKQNTRYTFKFENSTVPALTWVVLKIIKISEGTSNYPHLVNTKNTSNEPLQIDGDTISFTTDTSDGDVYFSYYVQSYNEDGVTLKPQTSELFEELWFTKWMNNIMLVEGGSAPSAYVPATVRDYKIVNHVNKTAKIVRNVVSKQLEQNDITGMDVNYAIMNGFGFIGQKKIAASYSDKMSYVDKGQENQLSNLFTYSGAGLLELYIKDYTTLEEYRNWVEQNKPIMQTTAKTPTEEEIAYSADDVSEIGYSWQDTTSPSPTIPAEVKGVEKIDILKTGKNLFDINDEDVYLSPNITHNGNQIIKNDGSIFPRIKLKNLVIDKEYTLSYSTKLNKSISNGQLLSAISSKNMGYPDGVVLYKVGNGRTDYNVKIKFTATQSEMYLIFSIQPETITNLQIELGDTATAYEPYKEQRVNITPTKQMYSTLDGSISDFVDVQSGNEVYNMSGEIVFDGSSDERIRYDEAGKKFYISVNNILHNSVAGNASLNFCDSYEYNVKICADLSEEYGFVVNLGDIIIRDLRFNDLTSFKEYLQTNPITVVYPLISPTETPIPQEDLKLLKSLKTEQGVTNIFVGGEVKPTIEARYALDIASIVSKLQTKLLTLQEEVVKNV